MKLNCWEYKKCGREAGGKNTQQLGICPVAVHVDFNMAHGGKNAGRSCWVVAGSLCNGKVQGTYAEKLNDCWRCDFMNMVKGEEENAQAGFSFTRLGIQKSIEKNRQQVPSTGDHGR